MSDATNKSSGVENAMRVEASFDLAHQGQTRSDLSPWVGTRREFLRPMQDYKRFAASFRALAKLQNACSIGRQARNHDPGLLRDALSAQRRDFRRQGRDLRRR